MVCLYLAPFRDTLRALTTSYTYTSFCKLSNILTVERRETSPK
jgi:hypothetical protein